MTYFVGEEEGEEGGDSLAFTRILLVEGQDDSPLDAFVVEEGARELTDAPGGFF